MPKSVIPSLIGEAQNRRSFVRKLGIASAVVGSAATVGVPEAAAQSSTEIAVLNFALNLEYLEAEFYTYAVNGASITSYGIGIDGSANPGNSTAGGLTTGGQKVTFSNNLVFSADLAAEIAADERAHVILLRSALDGQKIAKPNINLGALGFGFGSQNEFLKLARIFEDIGVTAYAGAAGLLTTPSIITTAASILAVEAEHVGSIRMQIARLNVLTAPPLDSVDILPPPSGTTAQYLSVKTSNGLINTRTPGQVLYLAFGNQAGVSQGGFFPTGVNGAITMSSAGA